MSLLVDPYELEDKVRRASKVENKNYNHSHNVLSACPKSRHEEDEYCNWNGGNGKIELDWFDVGDYYQELHGEAQEEEKVEFQKCNVDLRTLVSSL